MGRLIYGGTFNPLHIGHLRLAVQCAEMLASRAEKLDFVPSGHPPHKKNAGLLPFWLRAEIVRAAIATSPRFCCNDMEGGKNGPTYTCDTLREYARTYPGEELFFLVGSLDYGFLPQWRNGLELPFLSNLVVVPRGDFSKRDFFALTEQMWPDYQENPGGLKNVPYTEGKAACAHVPGGKDIYFLPAPCLEISASELRRRWLGGRDIRWLAPCETLAILRREHNLVMECWHEEVE